ncbi:ankyrin repeat-containing domain protein [Aspergillus pseudoustus]|uniref:Ankyrin repeat-containing domain protein n=1 Tax=Aspergillus pseudoustus TaxID=1810923 RepID=A0ABR4K4E8_9EURO
MPPPTLPPELIFEIFSLVTPSWRWGRHVRWRSRRERAEAEAAVRWFLALRLVNRTFDALVITHILDALRAGKLKGEVPLSRGPARPSTIAFVRRLLEALVLRTSSSVLRTGAAPGATGLDRHACSVVQTVVDGAILSVEHFASVSTGRDGILLTESATELRNIYAEALISVLTHIIGPGLILSLLQPGHEGDDFEMLGPLDNDQQQWRIAALMAAAYLGRISDLEHILSLGVDINSDPGDRWLYPPVMAAAVAGRVNVLEFLVSKGADLHALTVGNGDNVVHFAALVGRAQVVEWLIKHGVDDDVVNNAGATPLYVAASAGHTDVVRVLLNAKDERPQIDKLDWSGRGAIHWAVERGYDGVVAEFLSNKNTNVDLEDGDGDPSISSAVTPLLLAASAGRDTIFRAILAHPDVTISVPDLCRCAIEGGSPAIARTAMERLSPEEQMFLLNGSSLCFAAVVGSEELLRYLLCLDRADINCLPPRPSSPTVLDGAIISGKIGHVRAVLENPRLDMQRMQPPQPGSIRPSPFQIAMQRMQPDSIRPSPLHIAAQQDDIDPAIVSALLSHPVTDPNARDMYRRTPLHYAAERGHTEMVKLLIAWPGLDTSALDTERQTPLFGAAKGDHLAIVKMLLDTPGALIWNVGANETTTLSCAVSAASTEIVRLLLDPKYGVPANLVDSAIERAMRDKDYVKAEQEVYWGNRVWEGELLEKQKERVIDLKRQLGSLDEILELLEASRARFLDKGDQVGGALEEESTRQFDPAA